MTPLECIATDVATMELWFSIRTVVLESRWDSQQIISARGRWYLGTEDTILVLQKLSQSG